MADLANDKYRSQLRSTFIMDPMDSALAVDAIPPNLPTLVTIGWKTQYETVFRVTGTSGSNSSDYTLTGITKIKGADVNLPEGLAVNCLNHEEYFNQYSQEINDIAAEVEDALEAAEDAQQAAITVTNITSSATPTPVRTTTRNKLNITALAAAAELQAPTGTPEDGDTLVVRIKDNGTARALTYNAIYRGIGVDLPDTTTISKTLYMAFMYNGTDSKWDLLAVQEEG